LDFSSNVADTWRKRFFETGEFLSNLYIELVNKYGGRRYRICSYMPH
jgi:hypothetical protein